MPKAKKKRVFSVTAEVKAAASKVLPDPKAKALAKPKHKETLTDLLSKDPEE